MSSASTSSLADILYTQGFGTRRICAGLIDGGHVRLGGAVCTDPSTRFDTAGLVFDVDGVEWPYHPRALVMLHKPAGVECSQKPKHHPSVYSLLPAPLRQRGVQAVGRLDADTTGLLLFTDDGTLLHRMTSPKHEVPKVYEVGCKHPVDSEQLERLRRGVVLADDPVVVSAVEATADDGRSDGLYGLRLTLLQGKYHQVKRMVAAVGNRVEALHRSRIGTLELPAELRPGEWAWVGNDNVAM